MAGAGRFSAFFKARPRLERSLQLLAWAPVAAFVSQHIGSIIAIEGRSMQPTFNPDTSMLHEDVVLVNKLAPLRNRFRIGDVVTFWAPGLNYPVLVTKRIVALEGDIVRTLPPWKDRTVRVPKGHAWVEGDEPMRSRDSNTFGPLALGLVDGKVEAVLWPHWRFRWVDNVLPPQAQRRIMHHRNNVK